MLFVVGWFWVLGFLLLLLNWGFSISSGSYSFVNFRKIFLLFCESRV